MIVVSLLPLLIVVGLLACTRLSVLQVGMVALVGVLPGAALTLGGVGPIAEFLFFQSLRGAWLAWQAIAVILAGLVFVQVVRTTHAAWFGIELHSTESRPPNPRYLFFVCFLVGPFAESATGFGVGLMVAIAALTKAGVRGLDALVFGLFSQILVAWGALAIGTVIGAELAGITASDLGQSSALLAGPLLVGYLFVYWWLARRAGCALRWSQRIDDLLWVTALAVLLWISNSVLPIDIAGLFACGALVFARYLIDYRPDRRRLVSDATQIYPYILLTMVLLITRIAPGIPHALQAHGRIQPFADGPVFAVFHHASFWLLAVAIVVALLHVETRFRLGGIVTAAWSTGQKAVWVTLVFVVMAQWMGAAGLFDEIASQSVAAFDQLAVVAGPVYGAIAGWLTASNAASNGMLMGLQISLATAKSADPYWIAGLHNMAGSNFSMLSPVRIAMGCALLGLYGQEREIYRLAWPLGLVTLGVLLTTSAGIYL